MESDSESVRDGQRRSHGQRPGNFYRLDSNQSRTSIFEDVEMAHDELYSGPMAESLPTSVAAFSHRRSRADSTASFTYYDEPEPELEHEDDPDAYRPEALRGSSLDSLDEIPFGEDLEEEEDDSELERANNSQNGYLLRRSSTQSRVSVHTHLLPRRGSNMTEASGYWVAKTNQKIYMVNEDLYIVIAGFKTSSIGYAAYVFICAATFGLGWLFFHWLPKWYVRIAGRPCALKDCEWVVIENQWNEMVALDVESHPYGRALSTIFGTQSKESADVLDDDLDPILRDLRMIDYRHVRFFFHPVRDKFLISTGWKDPNWTNVREIRTGIDFDEKSIRQRAFGSNLIDIKEKSILQLLVTEVFHPFYVFQIASILLWSVDEYYYYAIAIFLLSLAGVTTALIETKTTSKRIREISRFECDVRVLRNGFWRSVVSSDLVPGDVYEVSDPNLDQFPSDSLLLSGDCIVNEAMLTGESVPVSKTPATDETMRIMELSASTINPDVAKHFLFAGTKIIRARRPQEDHDTEAVALAMVVRTGFNTTKGSLVRSMLFPKPSGFKFYRDSFRYIGVMGIVAALGFMASLVNFIRLKIEWHLIIVRALDLVTIVVPPALPATLTIGTQFAIQRLKKKKIFCISPQRVNVGGKIDIMCFDKTGTLTEEGLDVLGVRVVSPADNKFGEVISEVAALVPARASADRAEPADAMKRAALHTMATCHSLRSVDDGLVGDPLDLKMFEFTGWAYEEGATGGHGGDNHDEEQGGLFPSIARPPQEMVYDLDLRAASASNTPFELGVVKSFEFVSQLRRASVIVRMLGQQSADIYVKGAPECMRDICKPESFPSDYDELLSHYTHKGYRVIGVATKHLQRLSWVKAQKMKRQDAESDLDFVGFIIFENKLKPTTTAVLHELLESNIGCVMITGDNILTAISVARECGMINKTAHCFVPRFAEGGFRDPNSQLKWESIDNSIYQLDENTLLPLPPPPEGDASLPYDISNLRNYSIAVSGDVFRWIVDFAKPQVMQRMLVRGKVFARMSPDEKHELVEKLQSIDYCAGFCGDGANDCGALKAADVGISLSEAEASVAAPFTSQVFDIRCVPQVIREGRAALVTSFSCFKYMSLYSAIQFTSVSFLYASASNLGDFQFLFIDLVLILPIAIFMGWSMPYPRLSKKRPTADLVSRKVLIPLLGQMLICIVLQTIAFIVVRRQEWFIPPKIGHGKTKPKNSENSALFLASCFEYIFSGIILNGGPPFRERMYKNWPFVATIVTTTAVSLYMTLGPSQWLEKLMQLTYMSWDYRGLLFGLGVVYLVLGWVGEHWLFPVIARLVGKVNTAVTKKSKKRKEYKVIEESMRA